MKNVYAKKRFRRSSSTSDCEFFIGSECSLRRMKTLIIAEKPSVATDIARVIGGLKKNGDYYEGDEYIVGNALGHLLELACPEKYEVKRGKWTFAHLPVLPPTFDLKPISRTADKLKSLSKLIRRADVGEIVNACDAGREGELIFRYIMQATKAKQPIKRLWLQSMTASSIRDALAHLRTDAEMQSLAAAAKSRSEADWLVGINGTRAMTAFNSLGGGFFLTTVGRVQTPTLAIVVKRENEIRAFKSRDYWEVNASFVYADGVYEGRWFDTAFKKDAKTPELRAERIFDEALARQIADRCRGKTGTVEETSKRTTQIAPQLFDLTSLQREANNKFGFSAKTTLSIAQSLYEKHKVLTYPRTDSRALPEDYPQTVRETLQHVAQMASFEAPAQKILDNNWVKPNKRIFNNAGISDHFAIIPTLTMPAGSMSDAERKVYDLVVRRFMAVFYPAAEYDVTTRVTTVGEDHFKTEGKVLVSPGWLEVYGKTTVTEGTMNALNGAKTVTTERIDVKLGQTKPPARYTEATLLSAMEGAGKLVEDDELRDAMAEKGLGTPATRAAIIENLIDQAYMVRDGRDLRPTAKAQQLFSLLKGLGISALADPALTGEWEYKLSQIEKGRLSREDFMREIRGMTTDIVEAAKRYEGDTVPVEHPAHLTHRCPKCGGEIVENYRGFACTTKGCDFRLPKHPAGRTFEVSEVEELLGKGMIGPLTGFTSKMGRPFAAALRINAKYQLEFDFGDGNNEDDSEDTSNYPVIGTCPKCSGRVLQGPAAYFCEHTQGSGRTCDFRIGRVILQQEVSAEEAQKILASGKSSLLPNFVSNRSHRKFKAFLVLDKKTGKVGFEFEAREPKTNAKSSVKKTVSKKKA